MLWRGEHHKYKVLRSSATRPRWRQAFDKVYLENTTLSLTESISRFQLLANLLVLRKTSFSFILMSVAVAKSDRWKLVWSVRFCFRWVVTCSTRSGVTEISPCPKKLTAFESMHLYRCNQIAGRLEMGNLIFFESCSQFLYFSYKKSPSEACFYGACCSQTLTFEWENMICCSISNYLYFIHYKGEIVSLDIQQSHVRNKTDLWHAGYYLPWFWTFICLYKI